MTKDNNELLTELLVEIKGIKTDISYMKRDISKIRDDLDTLDKKYQAIEKAVGDGEMAKKIVYSFIGMILVAFAGAVISEFIK